jgi:hypothetical protein
MSVESPTQGLKVDSGRVPNIGSHRKTRDPFTPPGWSTVRFPPPVEENKTVSPQFLKIEDIGKCGIPYKVTVLDEQIIGSEPWRNSETVRQYILGHHDTPLLRMARRINDGWQGKETIREFERTRRVFADGEEEVITREKDLSPFNPPVTCNRWGRPLTQEELMRR